MTTFTTDGHIPEWTAADRVRKARDEAHLSQDELASITGLSRKTIGNYETGATRPSRASANLIAMASGAADVGSRPVVHDRHLSAAGVGGIVA